MNVSLTPELEDFVTQKVASGMYQTASEVVREALRLLHDRDERQRQLTVDLDKGIDQVRQGKTTQLTDETVQDIKSRGRARRAARP
ncbi:MAG: type II toxin-antitoxin system ParD family antitoxin [Planctomycetia bacterium]|nr:type II toxin-antitoxin system ParD family antitoxin [Planctomycetia bacterium]